jgi:Acetoacetate decarboxylase (ADC)
MPPMGDVHEWSGARPHLGVGNQRFHLPIHYHDDEFTSSLHTASYESVAAELPSDLIRPARWVNGRALISVAAFRYRSATCTAPDGTVRQLTPYAEVSVAAVVTRGPAPRLLPVLSPRVQVFVLQLPVTTLEASDLGTALWGFPKFVADMAFIEDPAFRQVTVSEGNEHVLTLTVLPSGPALPDQQPHIVYSALGDELIETVVPMAGFRQIRLGARSGRLELGEHPVGKYLRRLDITATPLALFNYVSHRCVLPLGRALGPARPFLGHRGDERARGAYTIRYPGTPPLDQYAQVPERDAGKDA